MSEFTSNTVPPTITIRYRITGKQTIERLQPLLSKILKDENVIRFEEVIDGDSDRTIDFAWLTSSEKHMNDIYREAKVINRLRNSTIIENKSNLAFLQSKFKCDKLPSYVAVNAKAVSTWCKSHWSTKTENDVRNLDWWVVKASSANGGRDVFIMNESNQQDILNQLTEWEEYVIQKYIPRPILYNNKKFHFRCYSFMCDDFSAYVYSKAFILTAGLDFDHADTNMRKHITNLSVNKKFAHHPGQIPCDLDIEYPHVFEQLKLIWSEVVSATIPFMQHQSRDKHIHGAFDFYGIDIIADEDGKCWLIEANRLPGLESSTNNLVEEDKMYDEMMLEQLQIVLKPLLQEKLHQSVNPDGQPPVQLDDYLSTTEMKWHKVKESDNAAIDTTTTIDEKHGTFINIFRWKAFVKELSKDILIR